ncbi:glycosyltransferase family 4 protein [Winogradskyella haliclonae]|uniref:Glycosyltransferase WbuB n=1 Tax=Winogradskyella haliclonae TaxID=2048558 RepID=A0ABQ2BXJ4_9FLAO|nr:glycosyltransferase family 4 protein [Winogradskyella haliclonae]GGI56292.1 glycosyltransferase WbuB [Winogradskyella haliclonae]
MGNNNKHVWLINQYATTPELNGDGHRHYYLAKEWQKKGYDVTLITSSYSHIGKRNNHFKGFFKIINNDIRTVLIKGNKYNNTNGISRMMSWVVFSFLLFFIPTKKLPKPDIIIVSSISLLPILNVHFQLKKKFKQSKFILEIRDIWPLTILEIGNYSSKNMLIKFLSYVEKLGYKKADYIVSLLMDANIHIENILGHKNFRYSWISNGYNLEDTSYYKPLDSNLKERIPKNKFVIGYAGALGTANAMETIIDVLKSLKEEDIVLCLIGDGNEKDNLIKRANNNSNTIFLNSVNKNQVQSFLEECDLLFFSSKNISIYKYGISANKTFDYMYASKPIILSAPTKNNAIELAKCGSVVPAENHEELRQVILEYYNKPIKERLLMGNNGKEYLLNNFTYQALALKYIEIFKEFYEIR